MSRPMKKWELQQKQKIHNSKIKNAKPTIKSPSAVIVEIDSKISSESDYSDAGLYNILKSFNLQQYTKRLLEIGFENDLKRLAYLTTKEIDEIANIIKMMPGHKLKFIAMIETLKFPKSEASLARSNSNLTKPRKSLPGMKRKTSAGAVSKASRNSIRHESEQFDYPCSAQYESSDNTIVNEQEEQKLKEELLRAKQKIEELTRALSIQQQQNSVENMREASTKCTEIESPKPSKRIDPLEPLPEIQPKNEVGVSLDSSKMRSTLHHIDIEEMCKSLAKAIRVLILHGMSVEKNREIEPSLRESLSYMPDFNDETPKREIMKPRYSFVSDNYPGSASGTSLDYSQDSCIHLNPIELDEISERSQEYSPQKKLRKEAGDINIPQSMNEMFKAEFDDITATQPPCEEEIYNFSKNMIIRCRMEKECSIICLIYLERLIEKTGLYITEKNWKRLVILCLILASKVWDDESYENKHFSQAFTVVSLRELNSMEMIFLGLIDYEVGIKNSDYAKYYFVLRTYCEKTNRSFPLKPMDVDTVMKLQKNADKVENELRETHNQALYQTL